MSLIDVDYVSQVMFVTGPTEKRGAGIVVTCHALSGLYYAVD